LATTASLRQEKRSILEDDKKSKRESRVERNDVRVEEQRRWNDTPGNMCFSALPDVLGGVALPVRSLAARRRSVSLGALLMLTSIIGFVRVALFRTPGFVWGDAGEAVTTHDESAVEEQFVRSEKHAESSRPEARAWFRRFSKSSARFAA
jgi:hypothetical protein